MRDVGSSRASTRRAACRAASAAAAPRPSPQLPADAVERAVALPGRGGAGAQRARPSRDALLGREHALEQRLDRGRRRPSAWRHRRRPSKVRCRPRAAGPRRRAASAAPLSSTTPAASDVRRGDLAGVGCGELVLVVLARGVEARDAERGHRGERQRQAEEGQQRKRAIDKRRTSDRILTIPARAFGRPSYPSPPRWTCYATGGGGPWAQRPAPCSPLRRSSAPPSSSGIGGGGLGALGGALNGPSAPPLATTADGTRPDPGDQAGRLLARVTPDAPRARSAGSSARRRRAASAPTTSAPVRRTTTTAPAGGGPTYAPAQPQRGAGQQEPAAAAPAPAASDPRPPPRRRRRPPPRPRPLRPPRPRPRPRRPHHRHRRPPPRPRRCRSSATG